ncbi:MAG TPA: PEGA domain-containing protein, partial [Terriglobia bacterium]|nr:PEGA domain-containing protein [Terriglobia bacterium]
LTNYKNLVKVADASETVVGQRPPLLESQQQADTLVVPRRFPVLWTAGGVLIILAGLMGGYFFRARRSSTPFAPGSQIATSQTTAPTTSPAVTSPAESSIPKADSGSTGGAVTAPASGTATAANAPPLSQTTAAAEKAAPITLPAKSHPANKPDASKGAQAEREGRPAPSKGSQERFASGAGNSQPGARTLADSAPKQAMPAPVQPTLQAPSSPTSSAPPASGTSAPADANAPGSEYVLETDPTGVDVLIDGKVWGRTDTDKPVVASLTAGDHTLVLKYHGVEVLKRQIKKTTDAQWQKWKLPISEPVP